MTRAVARVEDEQSAATIVELVGGTLPQHDSAATGLMPGASVQPYGIIRELGSGGMGTVFLARDTRLGRRVAIKFLHTADTEFNQRFLLEARTTASCSHENIVVIHEVSEHDGVPFMVLEYLQGQSLKKLVAGQ